MIVFLSTFYFLLKKIGLIKERKAPSFLASFVGFFSGFLQGTGLAGSDLRNSYLFSKGLTIAQVHGTSPIIGMANFSITVMVLLYTGRLMVPDLTPLLFLFPIIALATFVGRHILYKLSKETSDTVVIGTMTLILIFLGVKILGF